MYKHACHSIDAPHYLVVDMQTGKMIPGVIWADDEAGRYGRAHWDDEDKHIHPAVRHAVLDEFGDIKVFVEHGDIRLVPKDTWAVIQDIPWSESTRKMLIDVTGGDRRSNENWMVRWR